VLLSEKRRLKRERSKKKEVRAFTPAFPLPIHEVRLQCLHEWLYCAKRLGIITQHPERHGAEIKCLERAQSDILKEFPDISLGITPEQMVGTINEI
jgi:hypothetical protein